MVTDRTIPPSARERMRRYQQAYQAAHGETVEVSYRLGMFFVAGQRRGISASLLDQWTAMLTQKAAEDHPLQVCEQASQPLEDPEPTPDEPEPVAWKFELARARCEDGTYTDWGPPQLSFRQPCVPEGSIRNLTPLFAWEG